jgi:hypothetical protein
VREGKVVWRGRHGIFVVGLCAVNFFFLAAFPSHPKSFQLLRLVPFPLVRRGRIVLVVRVAEPASSVLLGYGPLEVPGYNSLTN